MPYSTIRNGRKASEPDGQPVVRKLHSRATPVWPGIHFHRVRKACSRSKCGLVVGQHQLFGSSLEGWERAACEPRPDTTLSARTVHEWGLEWIP